MTAERRRMRLDVRLEAGLFVLLATEHPCAFIAGFSASVVRAVTMFSFVPFGQSLNRKTPIEFSLISSAFLLLVVHPLFLFDVGF